jgi:hypothetical protein
MLSPNPAQLNRDAFVVDEAESTVRLDEHRGGGRGRGTVNTDKRQDTRSQVHRPFVFGACLDR